MNFRIEEPNLNLSLKNILYLMDDVLHFTLILILFDYKKYLYLVNNNYISDSETLSHLIHVLFYLHSLNFTFSSRDL